MKPKRYYVYQLSRHLIPVYPVYLIMFTEHGLSLSSISLLLMIWSLPVVVLEIPTGVLSDLYGRKAPVLIGTVLHAACFAIWLFADHFVIFALGFVCWGISEALISGALEALLFESLEAEGLAGQFDKIYARGESLARVALAAAMISGGLITQFLGYNVTLTVSVLALVVATVAILPVRDQHVRHGSSRKIAQEASPVSTDECHFPLVNQSAPASPVPTDERLIPLENESAPASPAPTDERLIPLKNQATDAGQAPGFAVLKSALVFLIHSKAILIPALLGLLVIGLYAIIDEYDAAVAAQYMPSIMFIALWGTGRFILEAIGAELAPIINRKIKRRGDPMPGILIVSILAAAALFVFAYMRSPIAIILYALYFMAMASMQVIIEDYIQQKIENAGRSTVHSVLSLALNLYAMLVLGLISIIMTRADIHGLLVVVAIYAMVVVTALSVFYSRTKNSFFV